ncbi:MAG TPA: hypothetical protein PLD88_07140 [Candidatus Berkiella sp.]|nr:hypothetical protein [Candidatus Berkiella sp.]
MTKGVQSLIKLVQNLDAGELCLVKIADIKKIERHKYKKEESQKEATFLRRRNLLLS